MFLTMFFNSQVASMAATVANVLNGTVSLLVKTTNTSGSNNNTFIDSSNNNITVTPSGAVAQGSNTPFSPNGWSGYFPANGTYLKYTPAVVADFDTATEFTMEFWVKPITSGYIVSLANGAAYGNIILIGYAVNTVNTFHFEMAGTSNTNNGPYTTAATYLPNQWYHIALVRNSSNFCQLFVNGVSAATATVTSTGKTNNSLVVNGLWDSNSATPTNGGSRNISNIHWVKGTALYTTNFTPSKTEILAVANTKFLGLKNNNFIIPNTTLTIGGAVEIQGTSPITANIAYSPSLHGGSAYFNGTTDYLTIPSFEFNSNNFTIEFWLLTNSTIALTQLIDKQTAAGVGGGWSISMNNLGILGYYDYNYSNNTALITSTAKVNDNVWHHIAIVRVGSIFSMYIDGVNNGNGAWSGKFTAISAPITIGSDPSYANRFLRGSISNLRIVNGTAIYTAPFTPPVAPVTNITNTSLLLNFTNANIIDNSSKINLITVGNTKVSTINTKFNSGNIYFDGTANCYLSIPILPAVFGSNLFYTGNTFTIEGWIYPINFTTAGGTFTSMLGDVSNASSSYMCWCVGTDSSNRPVVAWYDGASKQAVSSNALNLAAWNHIAFVFTAGVITIYLNGVPQILTGTTTITTPSQSTGYMNTGVDRSNYFTGYMEDIRLFKGQALYTSTFTPPTIALPTITDKFFNQVALLLDFEGVNNGTNNTFIDSSTNNSTITKVGSPAQGINSPFNFNGFSSKFNGNTDIVSTTLISETPGYGPFTHEGWIYQTTTNSTGVFLNTRTAATADGFDMTVNSLNKIVLTYQNNVLYTSKIIIVNCNWYHFAVVRDLSNVVSLYINGILDGTFTNATNFTSTNVQIGGSAGGKFNGYVSNVRLSNSVALYSANFIPNTVPLVATANTTFLTCQDNRFKDNAKFANVTSVSIYSTYGTSLRSANYTVDYSDNNIAWITAFSGVMSNNTATGIQIGTGVGSGAYGEHKYWRYSIGAAVTLYHPRAARIIFNMLDGTSKNIAVFAVDNTSDVGTIPTAGTSYAYTRGNLTITLTGTPSIQPMSPFAITTDYSPVVHGGSGYFNGTTDSLTMPGSSSLTLGAGDFTIETWIYPTTTGTAYGYQLAGPSNGVDGTGWGLIINRTNSGYGVSFSFTGGLLDAANTGLLTPNQWYHVAVVRSGTGTNNIKIYINGVDSGQATNNTNDATAGIFRICSQNGGQLFPGYVSSLRFVKGTAVYTSNFTPSNVPLTAIANTQLLLNYTNSNVVDKSGKVNVETMGTAKVSTLVSKIGNSSIYFDGTAGCFLRLNSSNLQFGSGDFTIEFSYYKTAQAPANGRLFMSADSDVTCGINLLDAGGTLGLYMSSNGSTWDISGNNTGGTLLLNTWYHIVIRRTGSVFCMFVNGILVKSFTSTLSLWSNGNTPYVIGGQTTASRGVIGYMDDFRITMGKSRYTCEPTAAL